MRHNAHHELPLQRTEKGLAYDRFRGALMDMLLGMDSESQKKAAKANQDFIKGLASPRYRDSVQRELEGAVQKAVGPAAVHVDAALATLSVMYANDEYIGERLMPVVPVSKRSDKYYTYNKRDRFAAPEDEIGSRAQANELNEGRSTDNYSTKDYSLKNFLDLETVQNQDAPLNEMVDVVEAVMEALAFRREKRILAIVNATGSYSGNTAGAGTVWSDSTGGTIIEDILAADAALWSGMSPTRKVGFTSLAVYNGGIRNNAKMRELFKYTGEGLADVQKLANFLGLDEVLISRARHDTANEGQTASYARRMTEKYFGVLRVAQRPSIRSLHFGSTFRMNGDPFTTEWPDPNVGKRGGIWARSAFSEDHKIVAADAGFLITAAIS